MANTLTIRITLILLLFSPALFALDNGVGHRPAMGWNSWNKFGCDISEDLIKETADAMVTSGLADAGYKYVNLDDCWQKRRNVRGIIEPDKKRFPSGIKALADYVHSKGLYFGIYSDAGIMTCQRRPGSLGFERQDAKTYAEWGVDYLKYDNCYNLRLKSLPRYKAMRDALNATGRPILYSVCNWGEEDPWVWGPEISNSWRTTGDIFDTFNTTNTDVVDPCSPCSMLDILDRQIPIAQYAGPGGFNDPDMLEIGNGGMTYEEYKSHFTFWAALKSPLIVGCDVRNMTKDIFDILTAPEVIAVNQDPLGKSARLVKKNLNVGTELWVGPLANGDLVAVLFNRNTTPQSLSVSWSSDLFIPDTTQLLVRDLWEQTDIGYYDYEYAANDIPGHGVVMLKFSEQLQDGLFVQQ